MDLRFTPQQEAFRHEVRTWLAAHPPPVLPPQLPLAEEVERLRAWQRELYSGGWLGVHWPREYGGRGASLAEHFILQEELARARAPELIGRIGVNLVGPTLIAHGTEDQKKRYLPPILRAEDIWCQLFSEPGAGSDLAALRCRAEPAAGGYVVTGEKVWTSYAQFAQWGVLLARTSRGSTKTDGISFLIVDMRSPGISVRPLRQMTGSEEFNQVRFDGVRVPREQLVGDEGAGWRIAQTTFSHERGTSPRQLVIHRILLREMLEAVQAPTVQPGAPCLRQQPTIRQELAQAWIDVELFQLLNWRILSRLERGDTLGAETSLVKLFWSEASQRMHETAMRILGPSALLLHDPLAYQQGRWARSYLYYRAATIFAGTSEIQRNILAQRMLGLPR